MLALFLTLGWGRYGFDKKRVETRYIELLFFASGGICRTSSAFRCVRGTKCDRTIFHAGVGPVRIREKAHWDTLCQTSVFTSDGICGLRSAFQWVWAVKCRRTIFHAQVGQLWFPKKVRRDTLC
jgi:hypothetical protein